MNRQVQEKNQKMYTPNSEFVLLCAACVCSCACMNEIETANEEAAEEKEEATSVYKFSQK